MPSLTVDQLLQQYDEKLRITFSSLTGALGCECGNETTYLQVAKTCELYMDSVTLCMEIPRIEDPDLTDSFFNTLSVLNDTGSLAAESKDPRNITAQMMIAEICNIILRGIARRISLQLGPQDSATWSGHPGSYDANGNPVDSA